jgi:hypothetical protein
MGNRYLDEFFELKCSGDVLNVVGQMNKGEKEITEAMALIQKMRHPALHGPRPMTWIDLCSGNGLVAVLAAHLFPWCRVIATDIRARDRTAFLRQGDVRGFEYREMDIHDYLPEPGYIIMTASHPCTELAVRAVKMARLYADAYAIMPCCIGDTSRFRFSHLVREKLSRYEQWCLGLWSLAGLDAELSHDRNVLSPANCIIYKH